MTAATPEEDCDVLDWHDLVPTVDRLARSVWRSYKDCTDLDDVRQAIWLGYFEDRVNLDEMYREDSTRKFMYARLRRAGVDHCLIEKANRCGYEPGDQYWYSRGELRALIPLVLTGRDQPAVWDSGAVAHHGARSYMDLESAIADVRVALGKISVKDRQMLMDCWGGLGNTVTASQRYAASRALGRLQRELGEKPPARGKLPAPR